MRQVRSDSADLKASATSLSEAMLVDDAEGEDVFLAGLSGLLNFLSTDGSLLNFLLTDGLGISNLCDTVNTFNGSLLFCSNLMTRASGETDVETLLSAAAFLGDEYLGSETSDDIELSLATSDLEAAFSMYNLEMLFTSTFV